MTLSLDLVALPLGVSEGAPEGAGEVVAAGAVSEAVGVAPAGGEGTSVLLPGAARGTSPEELAAGGAGDSVGPMETPGTELERDGAGVVSAGGVPVGSGVAPVMHQFGTVVTVIVTAAGHAS